MFLPVRTIAVLWLILNSCAPYSYTGEQASQPGSARTRKKNGERSTSTATPHCYLIRKLTSSWMSDAKAAIIASQWGKQLPEKKKVTAATQPNNWFRIRAACRKTPRTCRRVKRSKRYGGFLNSNATVKRHDNRPECVSQARERSVFGVSKGIIDEWWRASWRKWRNSRDYFYVELTIQAAAVGKSW